MQRGGDQTHMNETELNEKRLELESLVSQYGEHMRLAEETLFTIVCELQRLSKSRVVPEIALGAEIAQRVVRVQQSSASINSGALGKPN